MGASKNFKKTIQLGTGFSDTVRQGRFPTSSHPSHHSNTTTFKIVMAAGVMAIGFVLLMGRLFYVSVVRGVYFRSLSESNRVREIQIPSTRGVIYSRNGEVLASNRPIYQQCVPKIIQDIHTIECSIIPREQGIEKEAKNEPVQVILGRKYPESYLTAHAVGYMSEVTKEELDLRNSDLKKSSQLSENDFCQTCYRAGDFIGTAGLEKTYETVLRGIPGKKLIEVDSREQVIAELAHIAPVSGKNIYSSLDLSLQKAVEDAVYAVYEDSKIPAEGVAVIATNPATGEILALYSSPSFDPNAFVAQDQPETPDVSKIILDAKRPLFNRVTAGRYPPGSTFKIITAAAGLEEGVLDETTEIEDTGVITIGPFSFNNWYFTQYGGRESNVDMVKALARSNDIFFYKVGEWVGVEKLEKWAKLFGIDTSFQFGIEDTAVGNVRTDRKWYLGDTYHAAIGQGDVLATPFHVNLWTQIIANNGKLCKPTLIKTGPSVNSEVMRGPDPVCETIPLSTKTVSTIAKGLQSACTDGGTAYPLFNFSVNTASSSASTRNFQVDNKNFLGGVNNGIQIPIACKTGTAEFGDPAGKTHAWLTSYAPVEKPEIVVTVLVEKGGEGSTVAAPVVKKILQEWFSKERK